MTPAIASQQPGFTQSRATRRSTPRRKRALDVERGQFYTQPDVARHFCRIFRRYFDWSLFQMVEPSAGTGSFYRLLPNGSLAYDVEPKHPGIREADFLKIFIPGNRKVAIIGNPPFGKIASMAVRFFNHAAPQSEVIAFILPRTFRKASIQNRLDRHFHLLHEEMVPDDAFLFRSKPYNVPAVFQIWVRRRWKRPLRLVQTTHPDFEFETAKKRGTFAIQRVGAQAGRVHDGHTRDGRAASASSHYFIRPLCPGVRAVMERLARDFADVAGDVAGNPSLAKSEIVALYRARVELRAAA